MRPLGHILVERGLISQAQLDDAEEEHAQLGGSLGRILIDRDMVSEKDLVAALTTQIGMEFVDLKPTPTSTPARRRW
jgi:type IV pilus assembly protein PilB